MKEKTINTVNVERARHKITQAQLASGVGCSNQTISNIESGKFQPELRLVFKIVHYLNELKLDAGMKLIVIEDIFKLQNETL